MLRKFREVVEEKRDSKSLFCKFLVFAKDLIWGVKVLVENILERPTPKKIKHVNFGITYMCNSRCKICNIWKKYKENPNEIKKELALDEIKKIFKSKYLKNPKSIQLTGGEVFLRKDFVELCGFFIKKYPDALIEIPTNAVNPDLTFKKIEEIIKKYKPKKINVSVSLDGIGKTHDKIRGISGNYKNVLKLIKNIKRKFPSIRLSIGFTITSENYKDLLRVYEFSKKKNIGFGMWFGQVSICYYDNSQKRLEEFKWDSKKLKEVEKIINQIIKDYKSSGKSFFHIINDTNTYYFSKMVDFQKNQKRKINCYSGVHSLFLDPYGDIYPCIMLNIKLGNAKEGFDKIWMSERAKKIRKFIKNKKCACWNPCEICLSIEKNSKALFSNFYRTIRSK